MRFATCVMLPSTFMYFAISNTSNYEFVQLALYICVIIVMFLVGSFIYGDRLLTEYADQPIGLFLFPFLLMTFLWSIRRGNNQVKHVTTKPPKPKPKQQKESGLPSVAHSPPPVKRKQKKKKMSAIKENLDPKVVGCKYKMVPVLPPFLDLINNPRFKGRDLYEEFSKYLLTPEQLTRNDYPLENPENPGHILTRIKTYNPSPTSRICSRCGRTFHIENDKYRSDTNCFFHLHTKGSQDRYGCCGKILGETGCKLGISHVNPALPLDELIFKKTELKKQVKANQLRRVFGLDCEMVYTTLGFEVAKVTLVDVQGKPVYDTLVLPQHPVTDYNTVYSGISKKDLKDVNITFDDVQAFLLKTITKDTILVGHALQNDLKCLRIIHEKVVDTQVVFRSPEDTHRKKLKTLASIYLNKNIQDSDKGHCSLEDSRACMELMLKKIHDALDDVPRLQEPKKSECLPPAVHEAQYMERKKDIVFYDTFTQVLQNRTRRVPIMDTPAAQRIECPSYGPNTTGPQQYLVPKTIVIQHYLIPTYGSSSYESSIECNRWMNT